MVCVVHVFALDLVCAMLGITTRDYDRRSYERCLSAIGAEVWPTATPSSCRGLVYKWRTGAADLSCNLALPESLQTLDKNILGDGRRLMCVYAVIFQPGAIAMFVHTEVSTGAALRFRAAMRRGAAKCAFVENPSSCQSRKNDVEI